jgi:hypothetical protein
MPSVSWIDFTTVAWLVGSVTFFDRFFPFFSTLVRLACGGGGRPPTFDGRLLSHYRSTRTCPAHGPASTIPALRQRRAPRAGAPSTSCTWISPSDRISGLSAPVRPVAANCTVRYTRQPCRPSVVAVRRECTVHSVSRRRIRTIGPDQGARTAIANDQSAIVHCVYM